MKRKFSHEELVALAVLAPLFTMCVYAFGFLVFKAITGV
tara:strand:+ start:1225 stop:1341 length:117 start_codon:yes stop_codon:yes gene_type:complete